MLVNLVEASGLSEEKILSEMHELFHQRQVLEYIPIIQELPSFIEHPNRQKLIEIGHTAFSSHRDLIVKPFSDILNFFQLLKSKDIKILILTDAPNLIAIKRIKRLKIDQLIDGAITWTDPETPNISAIREKTPKTTYKTIISSVQKPNSDLKSILTSFFPELYATTATNPDKFLEKIQQEIFIVGDNELKDGILALKWGINSYIIKHNEVDEQEQNKILKFLPHNLRKLNIRHSVDEISKDYPTSPTPKLIKSYEEIFNQF